MNIVPATTPADLERVRELFREYFRGLADEHGIDIGYQGLQAELASLPGKYAPPRGGLWLAEDETGEAAGCIALRPHDDGACELKRMYVRPAFRGRGLGRMLGSHVIAEASRLGYPLIRLDTANFLATALHLYTALGFRPCPPYYEPPPEISAVVVFMDRPLP